MNRELKAFLLYAYTFIFLYIVNGIIRWLFIRGHLPFLLMVAVEAAVMAAGLFFAYKLLAEKFFGVSDLKRVVKGWLVQFSLFVVLAYLLFASLAAVVKVPSFVLFIFLNGSLLLLYFTYRFSVERFLLGGKG
ncbi:hypothetical protein [Thermovibrio ammonificans]|uniref:ABC transporter EcsB n=1 Tax=Thermovibrio ammonificans (strain DSM 15698 / JCM 12110 / HB-1) TaxID=648996 RepID=E8T2V3_THEA1|nr:hypothetical protein [Thermovibrio ammonificans]ADU97162.1 ABC transporter EcsB [Thermovibrio ammonificans HB-1]